MNASEKLALAKVYFKENADKVTELSEKHDFPPLLCSLYQKRNLQKSINIDDFFNNPFDIFENELVELFKKDKTGYMTYSSLVLCLMFNNTLTEENLLKKDKKIASVMEDLPKELQLKKGTPVKRLRNSLKALEGSYVVKEGSTYKIIHDKLFDYLVKYYGDQVLPLFINHAETDFICERFIWKTTNNMSKNTESAIRIPDNHINIYIERLLKDWENGHVCNVSDNRNMNSTMFTEKFIINLNKLDHSKQEKLAGTRDITNKEIALARSCYMGTVDLVKWLISKNSDINYCTEDGWFPLLLASQEGHGTVVKELCRCKSV